VFPTFARKDRGKPQEASVSIVGGPSTSQKHCLLRQLARSKVILNIEFVRYLSFVSSLFYLPIGVDNFHIKHQISIKITLTGYVTSV
jgi:hypothetical protein